MVDKFFNGFYAAVMFLCKVSMVVMIVCVSIVIGGRIFFSWTPRWGEETALMAMVWFGLVGAALPIRDDRHIRITMIDAILPEKMNLAVELLVMAILSIYAIVIIYTGYQFTVMSIGTTMPGLLISRAFLSASAPVAGAAILIACIGRVRALLWKRTS